VRVVVGGRPRRRRAAERESGGDGQDDRAHREPPVRAG
jgi:hypothetical protein